MRINHLLAAVFTLALVFAPVSAFATEHHDAHAKAEHHDAHAKAEHHDAHAKAEHHKPAATHK